MASWNANEHGLWCPSCGDRVAGPREIAADDFVEPEACAQCGFPDAEKVAEYHCPEDDRDEEDDFDFFDCGMGPDGLCSLAGTEDCDWECPNR